MEDTSPVPSRRSEAVRVVVVVLTLVFVAFGVLVGLVHQGFEALSGARAYVEGEGHWSKAQKDAIHHLMRFALLDEAGAYDRFLAEVDVTLGDRQARLELERPEPDMERVREGFLRGRNHPEDVDRMATFFRRYRSTSSVDGAIGIWAEADAAIDSLIALGAEIRRVREEGDTAGVDLPILLVALDELNDDLTELETRFSAALGEGARQGHRILFRLVLATALVLALLILALAWLPTRRLARSERRLKGSEARYRGLFESSPFGLYRSTPEGRILEANPALVRMLGYTSADDLRELDLARDIFVDPARRTALVEEARGAERLFRNLEAEWKASDGSTISVSLTGRILTDRSGRATGYEVFVENVTGRRLLENQLRQAQKMEALGQLTGGIAHDFNNLLTVILSSAGFLRQDLEREGRETLVDLDEIEAAARRGAEMVAKLLAFSRRTTLSLKPVNLPDLIRESNLMLRRVLPASIAVVLRLDEECPPVVADAGSVEQILLNLATNARDAMPEGGTLEVAVERAPSSVSSLPWVILRVRDSGVGMPPDILDRVFEPFFTTKPPGSGTGLGLPMVYGLARQQGGFVEIESERGAGTEVRVSFRTEGMTWDDVAEAADGDEEEAEAALLYHRDPTVRMTLEGILSRLGLQVLPVGMKSELRDRFMQAPGRVALVVKQALDDGTASVQLRDELRAVRPNLPFLVLGGYSAVDTPSPSDPQDGLVTVHDGWTAGDLEVRIRELLQWSRTVR
jgi:PAS domain S-box-containing protein